MRGRTVFELGARRKADNLRPLTAILRGVVTIPAGGIEGAVGFVAQRI